MSRWRLALGLVPLGLLRRYWWVIPLALVAREVVGAVLMATLVPWLWSLVAALEAARR